MNQKGKKALEFELTARIIRQSGKTARKPEGKRGIGRLRLRREYNIKRKLGRKKTGSKWIRTATNGHLF
jgi:hypothetical protein